MIRASATAAPVVTVAGVEYHRVESSSDTYVGTADKKQGHILISRVEGDTWVVGWATADAVPELSIIDLSRTAVNLKGKI